MTDGNDVSAGFEGDSGGLLSDDEEHNEDGKE